jgi:hypothetical protein
MRPLVIILLLSSAGNGLARVAELGDVNTRELDQLLSRHIRRAVCDSACAVATSVMARGRCLDLCSLPVRPGICDYAWLCGEACALGCPTHAQYEEEHQRTGKLQGFHEEGCRGQLTWSLVKDSADEEEKQTVRYIVAGQDGEHMWSLVESLGEEESILLSTEDRDRLRQLAVLAVDGRGLVDAALLPLSPLMADSCDSLLPSWRISAVSLGSYLLFAASLVLFFTALICCCLVPRAFRSSKAKENDDIQRSSFACAAKMKESDRKSNEDVELQPMCS